MLDPAGSPLTSANNILVLGSDRRQKNSKEPGAETTGPGRSDSIMLIRTGGGHAARLSIPRDTVVEIPGHGLQKINAAHAFGGPAESVSVIKHWLGVPINHVVEVNFEDFPQLIDAMGGVDYTGGCIISRLDGGFSRGGYTLRLPAGTHHLDGKARARARAHAREPLRAQPDRPAAPGTSAGPVQRDEEPAALALELLSPAMDRLERPARDHLRHERPRRSWACSPRWRSPARRRHVYSSRRAQTTLPGGGEGLTVSEAERHAAVAQFLAG